MAIYPDTSGLKSSGSLVKRGLPAIIAIALTLLVALLLLARTWSRIPPASPTGAYPTSGAGERWSAA